MTRQRPVEVSATLSVVVTIVVASMSYAGAVSERALFVFELPAIAIAFVVTDALMRQRLMRLAVAVGIAVVIAWAEVANLVTGQSNGPAARSALAIGVSTVVALVVIASRFPALFLVPVAGVVLGALLLGAGGEVRIVAIATVVSSVVALAVVESAARRLVRVTRGERRTRPWSVALVCLAVAAVASALAITQARHDGRTPHAAISDIKNSQVRPPWSDPFPTSHSAPPPGALPPSTNAVRPPNPAVPPQAKRHLHHSHRLLWWVLAVLGLLVLILAGAVATRYLLTRRAWLRLRGRLRQQPPAEAVCGAWVWVRLRLRLYRDPLPVRLSPDAVPAYLVSESASPRESLQDLAGLVASVAFAATPADEGDVSRAWALADSVAADALADLELFPRLRSRFVAPT
ncbi:MAG TPA: hypothetical protein VHW74_09765 [Mycobacteriales bacterium]|nr:hypothetical protein [Mycobacteriales bacterium]